MVKQFIRKCMGCFLLQLRKQDVKYLWIYDIDKKHRR